MATNDFLAFCSDDTGTNLLSQSAYATDPQLTIGNQPGVARSMLVNKALRQATYIASCFAQFLANESGNDVLDDATPSEILTTLSDVFKKAPTRTQLTGSGTYTPPANVLYLKVRAQAGGAGGGSGNTTGGTATAGGNTTFGTTFITCNGGSPGADAGNAGGIGGTATGGDLNITGQTGGPGAGAGNSNTGAPLVFTGYGGSSPLGLSASPGTYNNATSPITPAGFGNGGGGGGPGSTNNGGSGGGAGGYAEKLITTILSSYAYVVGAGGAADGGGNSGSSGNNGTIIIEEYYQ